MEKINEMIFIKGKESIFVGMLLFCALLLLCIPILLLFTLRLIYKLFGASSIQTIDSSKLSVVLEKVWVLLLMIYF